MKKRLIPSCIALVLLLTACGAPKTLETPEPTPTAVPTSTPTPEPTPTPAQTGPLNPLTGLPMGEEWVNKRPVAVMLNNLKKALPQLGVAKADIIYEVLAEGGITRMLGVYQSLDGVGLIGSVRSARPYFLELALGLDAVYLHAGGSEDAYAKLKTWNVTALDCVRGPYEGTLFWRDPERQQKNGQEHSMVTSGEAITELFPTYPFRQEHEEGYTYPQQFLDDGTPAHGAPASSITVPFSSYKTGVFTYDPGTGKYLVSQYGAPYTDGDTGEQVGVTNVVILRTRCSVISGDDAGRITVDLTSGGDGYYACGGKLITIQWAKGGRNAPIVYTTEDGTPPELGRGNTYVNIVPLNTQVSYE